MFETVVNLTHYLGETLNDELCHNDCRNYSCGKHSKTDIEAILFVPDAIIRIVSDSVNNSLLRYAHKRTLHPLQTLLSLSMR